MEREQKNMTASGMVEGKFIAGTWENIARARDIWESPKWA